MPQVQQIRGCCGIGELTSLTTEPKFNVLAIYRRAISDAWNDTEYNLYVFTDSVDEVTPGRKLYSYILKNNLGKVIRSPKVINPIHNSYVRAFMWKPNQAGIRRWFEKNKEELLPILNRGY